MQTESSYRVAILGAGPAGMSAALWLKNLGCTPLLFESAEICGGNARHNLMENPWVLGHQGVLAHTLVQRYTSHIQTLNISTDMPCRLHHIARQGLGFDLTFENAKGEIRLIEADAVLLAIGTRARDLQCLSAILPYDNVIKNRMMVGHQAFNLNAALKGKTVLIIGGGDNAHENADCVIQQGGKAIVVARSPNRVQHRLAHKIKQHQSTGACAVWCPANLDRLELETDHQWIAHIAYQHQSYTLSIQAVHLLIGYQPNTDCLSTCMDSTLWNRLSRDTQGYLVVDALGRTTCTGIYAAGDVCQPQHPCVVSALSSGAAAARAIERDLHYRK